MKDRDRDCRGKLFKSVRKMYEIVKILYFDFIYDKKKIIKLHCYLYL